MDYSSNEAPDPEFDLSQYTLQPDAVEYAQQTEDLSSADIQRIITYGDETQAGSDFARPIYQQDFQSYFSYMNTDITEYIDPEIMPFYNDSEVEAIAFEIEEYRRQLNEDALAEIAAAEELLASYANINIVGNNHDSSMTSSCEPPIKTSKPAYKPADKAADKPTWNVYKCDKEGCEFRDETFNHVVSHARFTKNHDHSQVTISWVGGSDVRLAPSFRPNETIADRKNRLYSNEKIRKGVAFAIEKIGTVPTEKSSCPRKLD